MATISASLIVKNEERFLAACLASLQGQVDEIVVADTGSTDHTVEIARLGGARLLHVPWTGDFAAARNRCLEACKSDWILYIDADECLRLDPGVQLRPLLDRPDWAGATVMFRPKTGYTRYWEHRLFRRHPDIRFEGKIHESHRASVSAFAAARGLGIGQLDVRIDHFGYDGDQSHKHPRNLPLLLEGIATTPTRPYYWYHLAETYAALGQREEALAAGERGLAISGATADEKEAADVNLVAQAVARLRIEAGLDPSAVIEAALQRYPGDHAMQFLKARWLFGAGRPSEALPVLDALLAIDPATLPPSLMAFDERIFGSLAREVKAAALVRLGDLAGAGALLRQAAAPRTAAPA